MRKLIEIKCIGNSKHYNIKGEDLGYYLGVADRWGASILAADPINGVKLENKDHIDSDYITNNVNHLYRLPKLSLSRDKLSLLQEKCDFKITRNKSKADLIAISDKTLDSLQVITWNSAPALFKDIKQKIYNLIDNSKLSTEMKDEFTEGFQTIEAIYGDDVYLLADHSYYSGSTDPLTVFLQAFYSLCRNNNPRAYIGYIPDEAYDTYKFIMANKDKLITDTQLNELCTEDSIPLDKESFKSIHKLVVSEDMENVSIGLTMIANCNQEASKTFLSLLFAFNSESMKRSKVWNQVNFKHLRSKYSAYVNMSLGQWGGQYDYLVKQMCNDKCLTLFASKVIANTMFKRVLQGYSAAGNKDSVFTLSPADLKLKPEYANQIIDESDTKLSNVINAGGHNDDLPF